VYVQDTQDNFQIQITFTDTLQTKLDTLQTKLDKMTKLAIASGAELCEVNKIKLGN